MNIVLLGVAGSGKGSISDFLSKTYGLNHISTGDLIRNCIKEKSPLGLELNSIITKGEMVPDEIMAKLLEKEIEIKKDNIIFDGFPRNIAQAKMLDKICKIDKVLLVHIDQSVAIERLLNRLVCPSCGKVFSKKDGNVCDRCNSTLVARDDDNIDAIKRRFEIFEQNSNELKNYYQNRIFVIDNSGDFSKTSSMVKEVIED